MTNARPGWYPDPAGDMRRLRYYDGEKWTDQYIANPQQPTDAYATQQSTTTAYVTPTVMQPAGEGPSMSDGDRTLRLVAFVLNVVSTVCCGVFLLPLAWMIPMTVHSWGIYKGTKRNTVAFGVCTLLFLDFVSGILLLCSKKDA